jgi:hypothetical protein
MPVALDRRAVTRRRRSSAGDCDQLLRPADARIVPGVREQRRVLITRKRGGLVLHARVNPGARGPIPMGVLQGDGGVDFPVTAILQCDSHLMFG